MFHNKSNSNKISAFSNILKRTPQNENCHYCQKQFCGFGTTWGWVKGVVLVWTFGWLKCEPFSWVPGHAPSWDFLVCFFAKRSFMVSSTHGWYVSYIVVGSIVIITCLHRICDAFYIFKCQKPYQFGSIF